MSIPPPFAAQLRQDLPPAAVLHVLEVFQKELATLVEAIVDAAAAGNAAEFRRLAHQIAGTAGAVGAADLEASARLGMHSAPIEPGEMARIAQDVETFAEAARAQAAATVRALA